MHKQTEKQFSLKDELFNAKKVKQLSGEIKAAYPKFDTRGFERQVLKDFPKQELMERIRGIRNQLRAFLPKSYPEAVKVILKALPSELDNKKTDNDFGDFIYAPYSYFVATYGCTEKHVDLSLGALKEITKRFSAEGALRDFLNAFPDKTLQAVNKWAKDKNYHVRRLASEGTRPNLPWAKRINVLPAKMSPVLDQLHADSTRYVVRSVANHLNDLSKIDKKLTLSLLKKWRKAKKQNHKELDYLTNHSLRTLIRAGDADALRMVGFASDQLNVTDFQVKPKKVKVGEAVSFSFKLSSTSGKAQNVMVDYILYFNKANGKLSPKTFKLAKILLEPEETIVLKKSHALKLMRTRALYPGEHQIELQINGHCFGCESFMLD